MIPRFLYTRLYGQYPNDSTADIAPARLSRQRKLWKACMYLQAILVLGGLIALVVIFIKDINKAIMWFLRRLTRLNREEAVLAFALVYAFATVFLIPGTLLNVGAGALFGPVVGYFAVALGSMLGAAAAFFLGRTCFTQWVERKAKTNRYFIAVQRVLAESDRTAFTVVFLARLPPLFPFTLFNYFFSICRVSFFTYFWATLIGLAPSTMLDAYMGSLIKNVKDLTGSGGVKEKLVFVLGLAVTILTTFYFSALAKRKFRIDEIRSSEDEGVEVSVDQEGEELAPLVAGDGTVYEHGELASVRSTRAARSI